MRIEKKYTIQITNDLNKKATYFADNQCDNVIWLDSNNYPDTYHKYDAVLAFSPNEILRLNSHQGAFEKLKNFINHTKDWAFGFLSYDLKNDIEDLKSENFDGLAFPELYFFQPKKMIFFKNNTLIFSYLEEVSDEIESDFQKIIHFQIPDYQSVTNLQTEIKNRISKENYLLKIANIKKHIARGDIYEANFCQEFYANNLEINPLEIYWRLNAISEPPFASFLKLDKHFVLSASPERYLQRTDNQVVSQPIKGTAKRSTDSETDQKLRNELEQNPKEHSENIMIVDLVRNDLSLYAERGSVQVTELCKPYTFKQVHQLISTITSTVKPETHSVDVIRSTFPMGSMTGAPKISAMQIIENQEVTKRSIYSGAIGYFSPEGNFDFNVVIRSIFYNANQKYVSFSVGSAITALSDPEKEYEECLIKAEAMRKTILFDKQRRKTKIKE